ncbi:MAG: glutamate--tRNA ligase [Patescibacteria group bacterium UBA2103]
MDKIRTRIAPSPTGILHVGTARTALINYLFAKKHGGDFIVRSEDTDKERSTKEFEENILEGLNNLGLVHDELYRQSEDVQFHIDAIEKLIAGDKAYVSEEESKNEEGKMVEVVRLRNPGKEITFNDVIRGDVTFDTTELGDFVIARSKTDPLYHLAVVVDDARMKITHVIRGEDHISNTPRQILIQEALGYERPIYAHLPLILGPDKAKLSKRHGATSVEEYLAMGYTKEAFINYLALLGWHPKDEQEIFTLNELIKEFELERVQKGGAIFSLEKLDWINKEHLQNLDDKTYLNSLDITELEKLPQFSQNRLEKMLPIIRERLHKFSEFTAEEFSYFFETPEYEKENLLFKGKGKLEDTKKHLEYVKNTFTEAQNEAWSDPEILKESIWDYASEVGRGDVLWPLRYALSGRDKSADPFSLLSILGKEESFARIENALEKIG